MLRAFHNLAQKSHRNLCFDHIKLLIFLVYFSVMISFTWDALSLFVQLVSTSQFLRTQLSITSVLSEVSTPGKFTLGSLRWNHN